MSGSNEISNRAERPAEPPRNGPSCSRSTAKRFALDGPSVSLDPRTHAYRRDVADIALAGRLFAPHYARPVIREAGEEARSLLAAPTEDAEVVAQLQPGEEFALLDTTGGWAWGYRVRDHVVGYVPADRLRSRSVR